MNDTAPNQNFRGDLGRHTMNAEAEIQPEHFSVPEKCDTGT